MLFLKIELQITNRRCNFPEKKMEKNWHGHR